jgi:N6-adenosine-specific RNA methylase IME4
VAPRKAAAPAADSANGGHAVEHPGQGLESEASTEQATNTSGGTELALYDRACRALAEARSVDEILKIRDGARQLEACARVAKNRSAEADAVEIRMRATRRLDQLRQAQATTVGLNQGAAAGGKKTAPRGVLITPRDVRPTLASQGIDKNLAKQGRVLGALSDQKFEAVVADARDKVNRAVRNAVREVEIEQEREGYRARTEQGCTVEDLEALAASGFRAGVTYVDVASRFEVYSGKGKQRSADRYYDTEEVAYFKAMAPTIQALAAKDCALFYWTSGPVEEQAHDIVRTWAFTYTTIGFHWIKTNPGADVITLAGAGLHWGMGFSTRANPELVLLAKLGAPMRLANDVHSVVIAPVMEHSEKPEEVRRRIERLYPGPYLELFARKPRPHWTCWGNEIQRGQITSSTTTAPDDGLDIPECLRRVPPSES